MVGDPGIEPGVGRPGGVTVRCRTLQLVAHWGRDVAKGERGVKGVSEGIAALSTLARRAVFTP